MFRNISGNIQDLKKNQLQRLKRAASRKIQGNVPVSQDFARELCGISSELGRQVGVLADRQGRIRYLMVGDAQRIFIPSLERNRAVRLRGLRLVHTHLYGEPLSEEDLADLSLLRLDYITAVTMDHDGMPDLFYSAHVLFGENEAYHREPPYRAGRLPENFSETIEMLEVSFRREKAASEESGGGQRAILVGVYTPQMRRKRSPEDSLSELRELCHTGGVRVVDEFSQNRQKIDPVTVVGSGKAREIGIRAVEKSAELMIFDLELSPAQASRLSDICDIKIVDRTQLILDIFARNAGSRDGKLQVELAQLRYLKGRLNEKDDNMSRLTGGIGGRGPGETKLEIGNRRVNDRISRLEKELKSLIQRRKLNRLRRERSDLPSVSIVGYTNAGKSTLLNVLTNSEVFTENKLFATLDPTTRRLRFPEEREIILSDTVGFIHDLPPELRRAFEATLEELKGAHLLLHCIDAADKRREAKIEAVDLILSDMELMDIPILRVYNKADRLSDAVRAELNERPNSVAVSALKRDGLEQVLERIESHVFNREPTGSVRN